jgi:hypothetical protein
MKKIVFIILMLFCFGNFTDAQINLSWANKLGGTGNDYGLNIAVDMAGDIYLTGYFENTVDFDPGTGVLNLSSAGTGDFFVSKYDASGNLLWAKRMGGTGNECSYAVSVDSSGNVYTVGTFQNTVDFDPGAGVYNLTSAGGYDVFVSKLDASGNFVWAQRMGGTSNEKSYSMVYYSGAVYLTGFFNGIADFDPGATTFNLTSAGADDVFVTKLDAAGNFIWASRMGGTGIDIAHDITVDLSGNVYTSGSFQGTADFDPGPAINNFISTGGDDAFISKLSSTGTFLWAAQLGGTGTESCQFLTTDSIGNVYATGNFQSTADFNPSAASFNLTSSGLDDIFVTKLNAAGAFIWAERIGGSLSDISYGIACDPAMTGGVYIHGQFAGTADFDPGAAIRNYTSKGSDDIFLCKLDTAGTFIWNATMGGTGSDIGHAVAVDPNENGNLYISGSFSNTADFDPNSGASNLTSAALLDGYFAKLCQSPVPTISVATGSTSFCNGDSVVFTSSPGVSYLWGCGIVTQNVTYTSSGIDSVTVTDANGCSATSATVSYSVIPSTDINGHVSYSSGDVTGSDVVLYKYFPFLSQFDTIAVDVTDGSGNYHFTSVNHGDYLIKVFPAVTFPTLVPTYYGNHFLWDSALVVTHDCAMSSTLNISMTEESTGTGPGLIKGIIREGDGFQRQPGDPIPGVDVKLGRNPGGQLVTSTQTDSSGTYTFSSVAYGNYVVYADIPGLGRDSSYAVNVDAVNSDYENLNYYVDSTNVYIVPDASTGISQTNNTVIKNPEFKLYPNPASAAANIEYTIPGDAIVSLGIYNVLGIKVIDLVNKKQMSGTYKYSVSNQKDKNLIAGVYFVTLIIDGKISILRLIINK